MDIRLPDVISRAMELLEAAGYEAWLVGGSVRDHLMGAEAKDWDIATSASADAIQDSLVGLRLVPVGAKFGTFSLIVPGIKGEVSSFRGASIDADLARRDFTINAMAWHPQRGLLDPHGGGADLEQGLIRCPGPAGEIFRADALRMVRAVRFAAKLGFVIEAGTMVAIKEHRGLIQEISPERIRDELSAILISPRPKLGLELLTETGLLPHILPELQACYGFDQHNPHHNLDVYQHTLAVVENTPPDLVLRLAALFHDIGKPPCFSIDGQGIGHFYGHDMEGAVLAGRIMRRLCYDNETIATVKNLVTAHMLGLNYPRMNPAKLLARVGREDIEKLFALQEADVRAGVDRNLDAIDEMRAKVQEALAQQRPFTRGDLAVNGQDLMEMGILPGAGLGKVLDKLLAAVINNPDLNEREHLLELARRM